MYDAIKRSNPLNFLWIAMISTAAIADAAAEETRPNVLFFAVDDLCDWVGPLGYDQAVTPNMDRLAARGVTFTNAHTAGVFCAPSRSAIFTGQYANRTGCYRTQIYFHERPDIRPMQVAFQQAGYRTYGAGKLFHHPAGYLDLRGWDEFFVRGEDQRRTGWPLNSWDPASPIVPQPYPNSIYNHDRMPANKFFMEWGRVKQENEAKMADTIRTDWACELLRRGHDQPFFVGVGLYAPHSPNYCPAKYFDLYDRDRIEPPPYLENDLDDLPPRIRRIKTARGKIHERLENLNALKDALHGYLACVSYADAMLGRLLNAIEEGPNRDNTIIVLWSDHGFHHGEKRDWGKHTLWQRTSQVPLIWSGPGIEENAKVDATVSLIDMYPTFVELCQLPLNDQEYDGESLAEVLQNPSTAEDRDVLLPGMEPGAYAIINSDWRYIHYEDGGEELYDLQKDFHEWHNLADDPTYVERKEELREKAPANFVEPGAMSAKLRLVVDGESFQWEPKP